MPTKERIIEYYDKCEIDYSLVWDLKKSMAMHYGYWDKGTKNLREALSNMNRQLATAAGIKGGERVLDAGCGVGGSSIFLAKELGCRVEGITLCMRQVEKARRNAERSGVASLAGFHEMDYCSTRFKDGSFDVVWSIESSCYCRDKGRFLEEAYRLLKKGGKLAIADFFSSGRNLDGGEKKLMERWVSGWALPGLAAFETFEREMKAAGFKKTGMRDATDHVVPSSRRLYKAFFPGLLVSKFCEFFRLRDEVQTENVWAARLQYKALRKGLWRYGIIVAEK